MDNIQMCDLKGQYLKIKQEVDQAIQAVIDTAAFVKGKPVLEFQNELSTYLGVKHVIGCANGTDALQIALMALDLKPGDEVITPDFTFIATVEVVALLGLTPVLVDVDPETFTIDTASLEKAITPKTRAIIPVHLFGLCANMDEIMRVAQKHSLYVIEDTAQALGADYSSKGIPNSKAGTIGHIGTTSFFPSKNLGCYGDGGALFTNDDNLADKIRSIANHGMVKRYHHDRIGVNSRLDSIQAAILRVKLMHLDSYNRARARAAAYYDSRFSGSEHLEIPSRAPWSNHIFHQYTLRLKHADRNKLLEYLKSKGIPAMVYYPIPLHRQKAFSPFAQRNSGTDFSTSIALSENVFSLPMHTELEEKVQKYICDTLLDFFK